MFASIPTPFSIKEKIPVLFNLTFSLTMQSINLKKYAEYEQVALRLMEGPIHKCVIAKHGTASYMCSEIQCDSF